MTEPARDPDDIRAWQRIGPDVTTSGRIEDGDIERLAAIGTRHVINLALDDHPEALAGEGAKLAAAGIGYTHIPIPFDAPEEAHYEAFREAVGTSEGPLHVHCIMNWRVSALFYRLHREQGMLESEALDLLHRQWAPEASDDPRAIAWARIAGLEAG